MSVRGTMRVDPVGVPVEARGVKRLEQLYRMSATRPVGAPETPQLLALGEDMIMMIILVAADVFKSIEHANDVLASKFFSEDGYGAIERLCISLKTMNSWCETNSQACLANTTLLTTAKQSITAKLRQFLERVSYWRIENVNEMANRDMNTRIVEMCDQLKELYETNQRPPALSRLRAASDRSIQ